MKVIVIYIEIQLRLLTIISNICKECKKCSFIVLKEINYREPPSFFNKNHHIIDTNWNRLKNPENKKSSSTVFNEKTS